MPLCNGYCCDRYLLVICLCVYKLQIENANHLLQEYFSGVREAQPIAKAQDHDTQGPIKESLASGVRLYEYMYVHT
jgi:hypothetical protein